jgi:excisionase family DNA binding protein
MKTGESLRSILAGLRPLLRYAEVAEMLRVDPRTLKRWTARGLIAKVRVGGRSLIPRDEVVRLLTMNWAGNQSQLT